MPGHELAPLEEAHLREMESCAKNLRADGVDPSAMGNAVAGLIELSVRQFRIGQVSTPECAEARSRMEDECKLKAKALYENMRTEMDEKLEAVNRGWNFKKAAAVIVSTFLACGTFATVVINIFQKK